MKKSIALSALGCPMPTGRQGSHWQRHAFTVLLCTAFFLPPFVGIEGGLLAQNYQWAKNIGSSNSGTGYSMVVDATGNVYITGFFRNTTDFDPGAGTDTLTAVGDADIFFAKYDASGNYLWANSIGSAVYEEGRGIALDPSGNVYITGYFQGTADFDPSAAIANLAAVGGADIYFAKYDNNGNYLWAKSIGLGGGDHGYSIATDASGNVCITGFFTGTVDFDPGAGTSNLTSTGSSDMFFAKYDAGGNYLWANGIQSTASSIGYSIAMDAIGNVYITGYLDGTADFDPGAGTQNLTPVGGLDIFFAKYAPNGNYIYAKNIGSSSWDYGYSIAADASGNVYITGKFQGTADFDPGAGITNLTVVGGYDIFFAKYDASGNYLWAKNIGSAIDDIGYGIAIDTSGNVYITGYFQNTADFDPGAGTSNLTMVGGYEIFFAKYDISGNYLWAKSIGGTGNDEGRSIPVDATGNIYITGNFQNTADFDPDLSGNANLTAVSSSDIFFAKYAQPICDSIIYTDTIALILHDGINCIDYPIVKIGSQWWMAENVNATKYSNGDTLVNGTGTGDITGNYTTKYYFNYADNSTNSVDYGKLYTWAAAMNGAASSDSVPSGVQGVCPTGWHLPSDAEWKQLEMGLGMSAGDADLIGWRGTDEGGKFKETGITHWSAPNTSATNSSGFTALPGGYRSTGGTFATVGNYGFWWTALESIATDAWDRFLGYAEARVYRDTSSKAVGFSCRCVKDILPPLTASITNITNVTCNGGTNGSATVTATGGTAPYNYSWSGGQTTSTATGLSAGTYGVTVTEAGSDTATAIVTITQPAALTVSSTATAASCYGICDGAITATASGGTSPYTYAGTGTNLCAGLYTVQVTDGNGCTALSSATITEPTALSIAISTTGATCNGSCDGSATATITGGPFPYNFLWSNNATTNPAVGLCAGSYIVTVTDNNGCTAMATASVTEPAALTFTGAISINISCYGLCDGSAIAIMTGGTPPYSFLWSNNATNDTATGLCPANYFVTTTDANGCTATANAIITEPAALSVSPTPTAASCNGVSDGTITATASGGTTPYTFFGTGTNLPAGFHSIQVTDAAGCTATSSAIITEPDAIVITLSAPNVTCNGSCNGSANAIITGGTSPYSFSWSNGCVGSSCNNLCAGTYVVTVTDANNCTATGNATITEPAAISIAISAANATCNGSCDGSATAIITGGTSPYNFLWSNNATTNPAVGLCAGSYGVTVTDANGCTATATETVTEPASLTFTGAVSINISCYGLCDGSAYATMAGGTTPYSFLWSNSATNDTTTGLCPANYFVTATDANGCTATANAIITQPTAMSYFLNTTDVLCNGSCDGTANVVVSGGTPAYTYLWSTGSTTSNVTGLCSGTNPVTVTDANNCFISNVVLINEPAALTVTPTATAASCNSSCDGIITATASGGTSPYTYAGTGTNLCDGVYSIQVTDGNGCTATSSAIIETALNLSATSTDATCSGCSDGTATATATGGATPYTFQWSSGEGNDSISGKPAGIYTVSVIDGTGCTDTVSAVIISEPPPANLVVSVSKTDATCYGNCNGSVTASVTGGTLPYTYNWSSGGTYSTVSGLCAGTYTLTVTDGISNTDTALFTITEPVAISIVSTTNGTLCYGSCDGNATATLSGGTSPYSYIWNTGCTSSFCNNLCSGMLTITVTDAGGCTETAITTITQPFELTISVSSTDATCNGCSDGTATATVSGGTTPYSYLWSNGQTNSVAVAVGSGSYTITVTDANGCTATATATVSEPSPSVNASVSVVNASCDGICDGSATASATGGALPYTYNWSSGGTGNPEAGLCAGNYSVTVLDNSGNGDTVSFTITEPATLNATVSVVNVSCSGQCNGSATAVVTGGTIPYTYSWSAGGTGSIRSGLCSQSYYVSVTDANGCQASSPFNITQPNQLNVSVLPPSINLDCYGECNGATQALASGGVSPYSYNWSNGETNFAAGNLCAGTYTVTVTDGNNCTGTNSVNIIQPSQIVITTTSVTDATCGNSDGSATISVTGGSPPYGYIWSNNDTLPTADGLPAGSNSVIVLDGAGCVEYGAVLVNNSNAPYVALSTITDVTCSGAQNGAISIIVTGGSTPWTYLWSDGATAEDRTGLNGGIYNIEIWGSDSCVSASSFTISEPEGLKITETVSNAGCLSADGSAAITVSGGTPPYSYSWNTGATTSSVSNLSSGIYSVGVYDANGCNKVFQVIVGNTGGPELAIKATSITCDNPTGGIIDLTVSSGTPPYGFNWSSSDTTEDLTGLTAGAYSVTVTDAGGCIGFASAEIKGELLGSEPICIVTVDSATGRNLIVWDKTLVPGAKEFNIYKEGVSSGVYNLMATVPYSSVSEYVDLTANPQQRSFRYRISAVDSCANESELSGIHKTMYLGVNIGLGNKINLLWDAYEGFTYYTFVIYRGTDPANLQVMDSIPSNLNYWTDLTPPYNTMLYYVVAALSPAVCTSQKMLKNYNSSKSNTASLQAPIGLEEIQDAGYKFGIYPNPNNGKFTISVNNSLHCNSRENMRMCELRIINVFGQGILKTEISNFKTEISLGDVPKGIYFYKVTVAGEPMQTGKLVID